MLVTRNSVARAHLHSYLHNDSIFTLLVMVEMIEKECSVLHKLL